MKRWTFLLWIFGGWANAQTQAAADDPTAYIAAQRLRLQSERSTIEQQHDARQRECWQRFAVNDCLHEVRRSRYNALDPLRAQELQLNAQERAWRTQQRDERLREKANAAERQP